MFARSSRGLLVLAALVLGLGIAGCDLAKALTSPTDSTATTATLTIWTSDSSPSPIAVSVDGQAVGILNYYRSSAPACGAGASAGAISVSLASGAHVVRAFETQAGGTWGPATVDLNAGGCMTYELQG